MIIFWSVNIYGEDPRFKFRDFYSMSQKNYFVSGGVSIFFKLERFSINVSSNELFEFFYQNDGKCTFV